MRDRPQYLNYFKPQTSIMIYYSAASSSLKKKTDLKGILSDGSCFSVERRVIFPLRNMKCKDASKANLHTESEVTFIVEKKKTQEKAITKFSPHVFESPKFKGSNDS